MDKLNQAQKDGVVVGLKDVAGVVPRLDVDQLLLQEPDTFNLFLLALQSLQQDDSSNIMGYYQIAGIHGLPKSPWDGVEVQTKEPGDLDQSGYCTHSSILFPTWHRPYLAMIEQTIYSRMLDMANQFGSQADRYRQAAQKFRLPYFDYYRPRSHTTTTFPGITDGQTTSFPYDFSLPQIFTLEKVMLMKPGATELSLEDNPLNYFTFPTSGMIPTSEWDAVVPQASGYSRSRTTRYPRSQSDLEGDPAAMNTAINQNRESGTGQILNMITDPAYNQWDAFSTDEAGLTPTSGSLEDIHGNYHVIIGNIPGHMSQVAVAAFDPVFWFHHCQIDRWAAIWQATHPDDWFSDQEQDQETADLLPFRTSRDPDNGDTFWKSDGSRSTETFGYTYPDLQFASANEVASRFSDHYSWSVRDRNGNFGDGPPADMQPLDLSKAQVYQYPPTPAFSRFVSKSVHTAQKVVAHRTQTVTKATVGEAKPQGAAKQPAVPEKAAAPAPSKPAAPKDTLSSGKAFTSMPAQHPLAAPKDIDESKISREWFVDIIVERLALNGAFTIFYFLGSFSNDPKSYMTQPTMAGLSHIFAAPVEACDNCGRQRLQATLVTSTAPMTPMLLDYVKIGELEDLSRDNVKPFLVKRLKWRVVDSKGERVDPRTVRGLKVGISSKLTPIPVGSGSVTYQEFPEVVEEILGNTD